MIRILLILFLTLFSHINFPLLIPVTSYACSFPLSSLLISHSIYSPLYNVLKQGEYKEMLVLTIANSNKYYSAFFGINNVSYVINRGSILSGIIIQNKFFRLHKIICLHHACCACCRVICQLIIPAIGIYS